MKRKRKQGCKTATNNRDYMRYLKYIDPWDERDRFIRNTAKRGFVGYWKRKGVYPQQARSYRTWKYNRSTQYKEVNYAF